MAMAIVDSMRFNGRDFEGFVGTWCVCVCV